MNKKVLGTVAVALFCLVPLSPALAATIRGGETMSVPKDEIIRGDLYIGGGIVAVSGLVDGDLIAAGGRVIVNGPVSADLIAAGGTVDILGRVGDDVRIVGGQVTVGSDVISGDLVAAGGNVHILSSTNVRSDLVVAGGNVILDGKIDGNVRVYGGTLTINGNVEGNLEAYSGEAVTLGPKTLIKGDFIYTAPSPVGTTTAQILGQTEYTKKEGRGKADIAAIGAALLGTFFVVKLLITIVTVLVLLFVFRRFVESTSEEVITHFSRNAVIGFAGFIAIPVALVILFATILGIPLALLGGFAYVFSLMLSCFIAPIVGGALLSKWLVKEEKVDWKWALLGVVVITILAFVPIIGWIVPFVLFVATLGALLTEGHRAFWTNR